MSRPKYPDAEVILALTICTELNTANGARGRLPLWARTDDGDPKFDDIAEAGRNLLSRTPLTDRLEFGKRGHRTPRILVGEALDKLTFNSACFDRIGPEAGADLPKTERDVTDFIRNRTRIFLDSWVRPLLQEAKEKLD
jgi:hypothetical protein